MRKQLIFLLIATLVLTQGVSEKMSLPVFGFYTAIDEPVYFDFEWDEKWFEGSPRNYNHDLCRFSMLLSEVAFIDIMNFPEKNVIYSIYKSIGIKEEDMEFDYDLNYKSVYKNYQSAVSFATKKIRVNNQEKNLVIVAVRGTSFNSKEWVSNLNLSDMTKKEAENHEGYFRAAKLLYSQLTFFLFNKKLRAKDTIFLITGHSRGAAIVNLLAGKLADDKDFDTEKIFTYTFASPNVTTNPSFAAKKYDFIWNIINAEDIIQAFPPSRKPWKYRRFGQTKVFANKWNTNPEVFEKEYLPKISAIYKQLRKRELVPFESGPFYAIQIDRLFTGLYGSYYSYYKSPIAFRYLGSLFFTILLPHDKDITRIKLKKIKNLWILDELLTKICQTTVDYGEKIFLDMHLPESYLAYLMALDENELYSTVGSSQMILKGDYECAVFDKNGALVLNYFDGFSKIKNRGLPISTVAYPNESIIGFPADADYEIVIYKDSILPSKVSIQIEHYDEAGIFLGTSEKTFTTTRKGTGKIITAGKTAYPSEHLSIQKVSKEDCSEIITKGKIARDSLIFASEFSLGKTFQPELGFHAGFEAAYLSFFMPLSDGAHKKNDHEIDDFSIGISHHESLAEKLFIDTAFLLKIQNKNATVPELRLYTGFKPGHHFQFFTAGVLDISSLKPSKMEKDLLFGIKIQTEQKNYRRLRK